jgi:hypothetical protein
MITIANIPPKLFQLRQWCVWRLEEPNKAGAKWKKMPRTIYGGHGSSTDPAKWETGQVSFDAYTKSLSTEKPLNGIGFVFYRHGPRYTGLDFDGWSWEQVKPLVADLLPAYVEVSQSGNGIHVIVPGTLPPEADSGKKDSETGIEAYDDERYFAITGNVPPDVDGGFLPEPDLETDRSPQLKAFFEQHLAHLVKGRAPASRVDAALTPEDEALRKQIFRTKDKKRFHRLFHVGEQEERKQSEGDFDLACILCRNTADNAQVERMMWASRMRRNKWTEHTGLVALTIANAREAEPGPVMVEADGLPLDITALELATNADLLKVPDALSPWLTWRGEYSMLVGREKLAGKSTAAASDARGALQAGLRVLWVTAEESQNRVLKRFADLQAPLGNLILLRRWPQSWEEVEAVIQRRQPHLIYVDSLASFLFAVDGEVPQTSELEKWQAKGLRFKRWATLAEPAGVCVLVHANKATGDYAGSVGIGAAADTIITMRTVANRPSDRLLDTRGRWGFPSRTLRFVDAVQGYVDAPDGVASSGSP